MLTDGIIVHSYFEKSMANQHCVLNIFAMSEASKSGVLTSEVIRRMEVVMSHKIDVLNDWGDKMIQSGYGKPKVEKTITDGLIGYERKVARTTENVTSIYTDQSKGINSRRIDKILDKTKWYNQDRGEDHIQGQGSAEGPGPGRGFKQSNNIIASNKYTSVLMIPRTAGGRLATELKRMEEQSRQTSKRSAKFLERPGTMVKELIWKTDPWDDQKCTRSKCHICPQTTTS